MKNINWIHHFVEFLMVILGILIAFQLSTCSEKKKQARLIQEHLQNIRTETRLNQRNLEGALVLAESNKEKVDSVFRILPRDSALDTVNNLSLALLNVGGLYLKKNAYRSLTESGDIRFIHDFQLKNEIVNLYEYYEWVKGIDQLHVEMYNKSYFPYLLENLDLVKGQVQEPEVYRSKGYQNILSSYRFFLINRIQKYKDCQQEIEDFLDQLETKL